MRDFSRSPNSKFTCYCYYVIHVYFLAAVAISAVSARYYAPSCKNGKAGNFATPTTRMTREKSLKNDNIFPSHGHQTKAYMELNTFPITSKLDESDKITEMSSEN